MDANISLYAFNRGLISSLGMARADLKRQALSADVQTNWMPRLLGSMMFRPGLGYRTSTLSNKLAKGIPFIYSVTDVALIECTDSYLRILLPDDDGIPSKPITRSSVGSSITNGTFSTGDLTGWTQSDQSSAVSTYESGCMSLTGTSFNAAVRYQEVTVASADLNVEHAVRIVVADGTVTLNIGTAAGDGTYAFNLSLGVGTHSIAFTPTGNFYVQLSNAIDYDALVASVAIETGGVMTLPTPWTVDVLEAPCKLRSEQSADVVYVACDGVQSRKIMRWADHSWSIVLFQPQDGPFLTENTGSTTLTPSGTSGTITLTASQSLFKSGHVGALFRLASVGQAASVDAAGTDQWSAAIEATGLDSGGGRKITIDISGTFVGTVKLQLSVSAVGAWQDVSGQAWTGATSTTYDDGYDNEDIYYRIGIGSDYTSGTAECSISITTGSINGICRVTAVNSTTSATAKVLIQPGNTGVLAGIGSTTATSDWWEGMWSAHQGWPDATAMFEGRLWFAGQDWLVGSESDAYESFDDTDTNDDGPIVRSIGSGPVDTINWLLPLVDLIVGAQSAEKDVRSSTIGGVITPDDFVMKDASTQGSANIPALKIDYNGIFIQRSGRRVYQLKFTPSFFLMNYQSEDLTNFVPDIAIMEEGVALENPGFAWMAVQRQPDTRIHVLMNDGTVRVLIFDPAEDEHGWIKVETDGNVVDCLVFPGQGGTSQSEDLVFYQVERTINGATVYNWELWAEETECQGGTLNKQMDAFVTGTNSTASATLSGLSSLIGETVVVWADGVAQGSYTVSSSGTVTLSAAVTDWVAGLPYEAKFKSSKLLQVQSKGTAISQKKHISQVGVILQNTHPLGLKYGRDFDHLDSLPTVVNGQIIDQTTMLSTYDDDMVAFNGAWDTDSRLCLYAQSPYPVTVLAAAIAQETGEK